VKRDFGNWMTRLLRGGTTLTEAEHFVLRTLVESLDPEIKSTVQSHFSEYNLVQREVDGRALNFYKIGSRGRKLEVATPLKMESDEEPLVKITFALSGDSNPFHAVLTAVKGRAFCVTFGRVPPTSSFSVTPAISRITQSRRSGVNARVA
jgi:hypothetical protein